MTRTMLKAVGQALYGPQYNSEMARQLRVHLRTFMRWQRGERAIPDHLNDKLMKLLTERQQEISRVGLQLLSETHEIRKRAT
jgi:hypothetical protein